MTETQTVRQALCTETIGEKIKAREFVIPHCSEREYLDTHDFMVVVSLLWRHMHPAFCGLMAVSAK